MRLLGVALFLSGLVGTGLSIGQAYSQSRPRDLLFATLAPIAAIAAIIGLVLTFVPGFFG